MKNKKEPKFRWGLCVIICLSALLFEGCGDKQSPERDEVHFWRPEMIWNPGTPARRYLDAWAVSTDTQGRNIYGASHGFFFQLLDEHKQRLKRDGVRIDIKVVEHWSPVGYGDLWNRTTPKGKKYGFIRVVPEEGSGVYDGVLHGRTDVNGLLRVWPGLGDPKATFNLAAPLDPDYQWPGPGDSIDDFVFTYVQFKITLPGTGLPVDPIYVWSNYDREPDANFWPNRTPGVYNRSFQGIGKLTPPSSMIQSDGPNTVEHSAGIFDLSLYDSPAPRLASSNYPRVTSGTKPSLSAEFLKVLRKAMAYVTTSDVTLDSLYLTQLRWDPDIGWAYFPLEPGQGLPGHWIAEPNDPNDIIEMLSVTSPYAFWAVITLPEPFYGDTATTTVILRATDRENVVQSKIPLTMTLVEKSPDNLTVTARSDWFVVSVDPDFHGYYQDQEQNTYTVLYMPEQTHPELGPPGIFSDFNADDRVDFYDLALFADHWQDSVHDPNTGYDALYEEPYTWDGEINMTELRAFAEHWLSTP